MRKKATFLFVIVSLALILSGCTANIDVGEVQPVYNNFIDQSGAIGEYTFHVDSNLFPFGATVLFSREEGDLFIELKDPSGKSLHSDTLKHDYVYINYPESENLSPREQASIESLELLSKNERELWGFFNLLCYPEQAGVYTLEVTGESATGDITIFETAKTVRDFTGKMAFSQFEVEEVGQVVRFIFGISADAKGKLFARVFDPNNEQIRVVELTASNPNFAYEAEAEMTGTYTAYIYAEDASCDAGSKPIERKKIPYSIFIMPTLIVLAGIVAYLLTPREYRKLAIWGAIYWLAPYFIGGMIFDYTSKAGLWSLAFWGSTGWISTTLMGSLVVAILIGIAPLLSRWVKEIRECIPEHLIGFAAGFVIAPSILEGLNGIMSINEMLSNITYPIGVELPGFYTSAESVILKILLPVISRIGLMVIVFALTMIIIWAFRQKTALKNRVLIILGSIVGIVGVNVLYDYLLVLGKDTVSMFTFTTAYSIGSPLSQGLTITIILIAVSVYLFTKRRDLLPLAQKACEVTIDNMRSE
jgi:hypothetical protein